MTPRRSIIWLLATVFLTAVRAAEMRLNGVAVGTEFVLGSGMVLAGLAGAAAIHATVILWLAAQSRLRDPARVLAILGVGFGFVIVNNLEAVVFHIAPIPPLLGLAALCAGVHALVTVVMAKLVAPTPSGFDGASSPFHGFTPSTIVARVLTLGFVYSAIYFVAGATIYPFVREFYANKPLPSTGTLFALQAFVRGPLFVAIGVLVIAVLRSTRVSHAAAVGCVLAGLGGVTSLLAPNPLFPDAIRYVHLAEVTASNFVFGWLVGWTLTRIRRADVAVSPAVAKSSS